MEQRYFHKIVEGGFFRYILGGAEVLALLALH